MNKKIRYKLLTQVVILFLVGSLITGLITYLSSRDRAQKIVWEQTEERATDTIKEVERYVSDIPTHEWLLKYWMDNWDKLDIEYDVEYSTGTKTEEKVRKLTGQRPDLQLSYVSQEQVDAMSPEEQKLFAEITYSWMLTRVNQIKQSYNVDFLFCVAADKDFKHQFFIFSGAEKGAKRGTNYEEAYILGTQVEVTESQQLAMKRAKKSESHLANAGVYVDYYSYWMDIGDTSLFMAMTYNVSNMLGKVQKDTIKDTIFAVIFQLILMVLSLILLNLYMIKPLKRIQESIRDYKNDKNSKQVERNMKEIQLKNEMGELSHDVVDLTHEIDDYVNKIETITAKEKQIETELNMAKQIQLAVLPHIFPPYPEREEFDLYAIMEPAKEVGGDFYDFFLIDEDHLGMVMADVSGKGVPAALFMMVSKIIIKSYALLGLSPQEVIERTNKALCSNNQVDMFVTVWIGILEISTGKIEASNAGHEPPIVMRDGKFVLMKDKHSFVVGGLPTVKYNQYEFTIQPGDTLFLYTDGLPEACDSNKEMFGLNRLVDTLNEGNAQCAEQIVKKVRDNIETFVGDAEQFDDMTMLCMTYKGIKE